MQLSWKFLNSFLVWVFIGLCIFRIQSQTTIYIYTNFCIFIEKVISDTAMDVDMVCRESSTEDKNEALQAIQRIESIENGSEDEEGPHTRTEFLFGSPCEPSPLSDTADTEVFLFDDHIPSVPSNIPSGGRIPAGSSPLSASYRRRNMLLRMISDPKCYNPRLLRSVSFDDRARDRSRSRGEDGEEVHEYLSCSGGRKLFISGEMNELPEEANEPPPSSMSNGHKAEQK